MTRCLNHMSNVRIVATFDPDAPTPRDLRERFSQALRDAIQRARLAGQIDVAQAEELIRTLPERERA